jgi:hypothetical protein
LEKQKGGKAMGIPSKPVSITETETAKKLTPIEYLTVTGEAPTLDQVQILTLDDLNYDDAWRLLQTGISKRQLLMLYGVKEPSGPYYKQLADIMNDTKNIEAAFEQNPKEAETVTETAETVETVNEEAETVDEEAETVNGKVISNIEQIRQGLKIIEKLQARNSGLDAGDIQCVIADFLDIILDITKESLED